MTITGTHFNYFLICHRKLWLFAHSIQMEHTSDLVTEGKLIHETSYLQRTSRYQELELDGVKIDYYDPNKKTVHEVKKSNKIEQAHEWQLKYYLYKLEMNGIKGATGILEYPKLRKKEEVFLSEIDREQVADIEKEIEHIVESNDCPAVIHSKYCKKCSYYDFCYIQDAGN